MEGRDIGRGTRTAPSWQQRLERLAVPGSASEALGEALLVARQHLSQSLLLGARQKVCPSFVPEQIRIERCQRLLESFQGEISPDVFQVLRQEDVETVSRVLAGAYFQNPSQEAERRLEEIDMLRAEQNRVRSLSKYLEEIDRHSDALRAQADRVRDELRQGVVSGARARAQLQRLEKENDDFLRLRKTAHQRYISHFRRDQYIAEKSLHVVWPEAPSLADYLKYGLAEEIISRDANGQTAADALNRVAPRTQIWDEQTFRGLLAAEKIALGVAAENDAWTLDAQLGLGVDDAQYALWFAAEIALLRGESLQVVASWSKIV